MGGTRCTVCDHPQRKAIDLALTASSERSVAKQHGLSPAAIHRHKTTHLRPSLARVAASREDVSANGVIDRMVELQTRTLALLDAAEKNSKPVEVARIIRECRENELALARLTGLLREGSTTINDNRVQIAAMANVSEEDLRTLAAGFRREALPC